MRYSLKDLIPPRPNSVQGLPRKLGIELELSGVELDQLTTLVTSVVGGTVLKQSPYEAKVIDTTVGSIRVEFDAALFRELKVRNFFSEFETELLGEEGRRSVEQTLASLAAWLVPYEIVFPAVPLSLLDELERVRAKLGEYAQGTGTSVVNAFGLHLNIELPDFEVDTILAYLRAFFVLYEELKQSHSIDTTRSLSGFISPFDKRYVTLVLSPNYRPSIDRFIDDYLQANPTRNRPLDLLPLLAYIDEARVRAVLPEEKISPRPAFHYRLPNSSVDEDDWSFAREWSIWMKVERLASDPVSLVKRSRYKLRQLQGPFFYWLKRLWRTKPLLSDKPMIAVTGPDKGGYPAWICTSLAVRRAGGYPVRLTPSMFADDPSLPPFHGLILGGGADIDPVRYGQELQAIIDDQGQHQEKTTLSRRVFSRLLAPLLFLFRAAFSLTQTGVDRERDDFEQHCLERALREKLPVLGICRGAQFLNIYFGGTLIDDLSDFYGEVDHSSTLLPKTRIEIEPRSYLGTILGVNQIGVNSLHKQAVDQLGTGLRVTARTSTGIIQAVELESMPCVLGVQWHPEYLPASRLQLRLFQALVQEALSRKR